MDWKSCFLLVLFSFLSLSGEAFGVRRQNIRTRLLDQADIEAEGSTRGYVILENNQFSFTKTKPAGSFVASALFRDNFKVTGWGELHVATSEAYTDFQQAFAAGFIEGAISHESITNMRVVNKYLHGKEHVYEFLRQHDAYLRQESNRRFSKSVNELVASPEDPKTDGPDQPYWYHISLMLAQLDGLLAGYNSVSPSKMILDDVLLLQVDADSVELERLKPEKKTSEMSHLELIEFFSSSRCSLLIKWTGDDLLLGHTTWADYSELLRTWKSFNLKFRHVPLAANVASFSSYPGFLTSSDDFYVLSSKLVISETTVNVLDESLLENIRPTSGVLGWLRSMVANRMAHTAAEWLDIFSKYSMGTMNSQWFVLDYSKFKAGLEKLEPNTITLLEQAPGRIETKDLSEHLSATRYVASYNTPMLTSIRHILGYDLLTQRIGDEFSYRDCARAKLFRRLQSEVKDVASLKTLMRRNRYMSDVESGQCPRRTVAARGDLVPGENCPHRSMTLYGGTESKVFSSKWLSTYRADAVLGPSTDGQAPFSWSRIDENIPRSKIPPHPGQPDTFDFDWIALQPDTSVVA